MKIRTAFRWRLGLGIGIFCLASLGAPQDRPGGLTEEFLKCVAPKGSVALVVGAPYLTLTKWTLPEKSLKVLADNYGCKVFEFGKVLAVGPALRTENSLPKGKPNALHSLTPEKAFSYLLATLDERRWKSLTSSGGLGFGDLNELQSDLLRRAIAPDGKLVVRECRRIDAPFVDMTPQMNSLHIRLGKAVRPYFSRRQDDGKAFWLSNTPNGKYYLASSGGDDSLSEPPAQTEVSNGLRAGGLDLADSAFDAEIEIAGGMSVAELVRRISAAANLELLADARYGEFPVVFLGAPAKATARDLLKGLAVSLSATFRKVGPAYLLTDDVSGIGSKRQAWFEFDRASERLLEEVLKQGSARSKEAFGAQELTCYDDLLMPSSREIEAAAKNSPQGGLIMVETAYGRLGEQQKQEIKAVFEYASQRSGEPATPLNAETPVALRICPSIEILLTNLEGPVRADRFDMLLVDLAQKYSSPAKFDAGRADPERLQAALKAFPSRAVALDLACFPSDGAFLKTLSANGFDAVWIYVPTDVLLNWSNGSRASAYDLSTATWNEAVSAVHEAGLQAKILVDPLTRIKPAAETVDKDILGRQATVTTYFKGKLVDQIWTDPSSPRVQSELDAVADWIAGQPLDGVAIRRSAAPGYVLPWPFWVDSDPPGLGYSGDARLRFLRKWSVDPVDVSWVQYDRKVGVKAFEYSGFEQSQRYSGIWNAWRSDVADTCVRRFARRIRQLQPEREPSFLCMFRQEQASWYATSDLSGKSLPGTFARDAAPPNPIDEGVQWARTFGKRVDATVTISRTDGTAMVASRLEYAAKYCLGDGVVLVMTPIADVAEFVRTLLGKPGS